MFDQRGNVKQSYWQSKGFCQEAFDNILRIGLWINHACLRQQHASVLLYNKQPVQYP
jgi:hypothetical protein